MTGAEPATSGADTAVEVSGLGVSYQARGRRVPVVRDVGFTIGLGRTLGLVGESGSGKSTVARTLLGHLRHGSRVDAGTVRVLGEDVFALPQERLRTLRGGRVSLVSQNAGQALTPSMRVGGQLREALAVHGLPATDERLEELARLVHLPDPGQMLRRYPHQLSGGQQQRVAIAMAVATDPRVLVLDEPTTALDVLTQAAVLALVEELRERLGMAVLIVSHDLGVVSAIADEVLVMRAGEVVESGPAGEVLRSPSHEYTRHLLASAPRVETAETVAPSPVGSGAAGSARVAPAGSELIDPAGSGPEGPAPLLLRCRGVDVRYGGAPSLAVAGFDLDLHRGDTVAVVGESGSGKSTVASALAGLTAAESGQVTFHEPGTGQGTTPAGTPAQGGPAPSADLLRPARRRSPELRRIVQLVFQNADLALNPRRTVGDAIARPLVVFGRARGRSALRREVDRLLVEVGLGPEFASRVPAQLSGGQRQRVGIARALAAEPELLIADEITTALDVSVQADVLELLDELRRRRGLSCLFISHDLAVVRSIADRIVVMKDGCIVEQGPAGAVLSGPRHPYTRTLLDAVLEPGTARLPDLDIDRRVGTIDPAAPLRDVGGGHLVREYAGHVDRGEHAA